MRAPSDSVRKNLFLEGEKIDKQTDNIHSNYEDNEGNITSSNISRYDNYSSVM